VKLTVDRNHKKQKKNQGNR